MKRIALSVLCCLWPAWALASGNAAIGSFTKAKQFLEREVYTESTMRLTLYCTAPYKENKEVLLPQGFNVTKHVKRARRIEWEHVVPAENFGRTFAEWREGHALCVDRRGKSFKGRRCAEKINHEFRYMQSDMYNLFPAIGAVNALRSNYNFTPMQGQNAFGQGCDGMVIQNKKVSPPQHARGQIARAYLYMEQAYTRYTMSKGQRKIMQAWNAQYPVTHIECQRTKRIEKIQGNENPVVKELCIAQKYW